MVGTISEAAPIACTLDAGDFKERLAWIADLNRRALLGARRDDLRLELTYAPYALKDVHELMCREQQCCAFLDFDLRVEGNAVRLVVTAPEAAREAAALVFEPFQSKDAVASAASCGCNSGCAQ
ncbi:conserved hypothetical protein [Mesorhizobium metallidurans STM 2683]|uniref:Uncharacterized protein n=1 Tax=Mesorhizobium metallidurans STM 2683 TaxID=1297569 RepID=M5F344_9HYPH|nr:hypothetical protein [Mesorhizobium metallidurans]CCV06246.1 conserved hypothetical protein [Mesorhizobium metallidurans STM 2683]